MTSVVEIRVNNHCGEGSLKNSFRLYSQKLCSKTTPPHGLFALISTVICLSLYVCMPIRLIFYETYFVSKDQCLWNCNVWFLFCFAVFFFVFFCIALHCTHIILTYIRVNSEVYTTRIIGIHTNQVSIYTHSPCLTYTTHAFTYTPRMFDIHDAYIGIHTTHVWHTRRMR